MKYQTQGKNNARQLTLGTLTVLVLESSGYKADNGMRQICYYNRNKIDTSFNSFLTTREQTSQEGEIKFYIVQVINNTNKTKVAYSELCDKLNRFKNDNIQSKLQRLSEGDVFRTKSK